MEYYISEIKRAVQMLNKNGAKSISIMHCILNYPTKDKDANLGMINGLKNEFKNILIGYSDHTKPKNLKIGTKRQIFRPSLV